MSKASSSRRVIFPHRQSRSGSDENNGRQGQKLNVISSRNSSDLVSEHSTQHHDLQRSTSFPTKSLINTDIQQNERTEMLPLPKVLPGLQPRTQPTDARNDKFISSHRTYYPAASIPTYHNPQIKAATSTPNKQPVSILRSSSTGQLDRSSRRRRSSIVFRSSSTIPIDDVTSSSNIDQIPPTSSLTLASPTSIRSLISDTDLIGREGQHEMGETESDLNKITVIPPKVLHRQDNTLRRNASDTVVAKSEEEVDKRRKKSVDLKDPELSLEDGVTRHVSLECLPNRRHISFDPHIWVYEYSDDRHEFDHSGGKWFTEDELDQFKQDAIQRIRARNVKMMSAGQGRVVTLVSPAQDRSQTPSPLPIPPNEKPRSVVFTHPALGFEDEFDPVASVRSGKKSRETLIQYALSREVRNVLVVDPHEICLTLFTKCFKYIVPHVSVATARSGEEAMSRWVHIRYQSKSLHLFILTTYQKCHIITHTTLRIQAAQKAFPVTDGGAVHGFDIILVEERLFANTTDPQNINLQCAGDDAIQRERRLTSGSAFIQFIVKEEHALRDQIGHIGNYSQQPSIRFSLLIGVSAHLNEDEVKLKMSGADYIFGKPPPEMNSNLRNDMLKVLMMKRNSDCSLFD
eukprot:scaffold91217_cov69-Cyclotella_meneghiniana.AAC.9